MNNAILFSGHLPDLPGREHPRFPAGMRFFAEILFRDYLKENAPSAVYLSLAAGADLLFANEALNQGIPVVAVLPCSVAHFRQFSILPYDADGFYNRMIERVLASAAEIVEMPFTGEGIPDFNACNQTLLEMLKEVNGNPEAVLFLSPSSLQLKGGTSSFAALLQNSGFRISNLYPDFSGEGDIRDRDFSELLHGTGLFENLDQLAVYHQKRWKSGIRLSLSLLALVLVLSTLDGVDTDLFGPLAGLVRNLAVAAAILAAVLEIFLNPGKGSDRKEWIVNRARAEKRKQRFWMFLFTFDEEADDARYRQNKTLCSAKAQLSFLSASAQLEIYRKWRIEDQFQYFVRKEEILGRQLKNSRLIQRVLLLLGVVYGVLRIWTDLSGRPIAWVDEINLLACFTGIAVVVGNYRESINTEDLFFQYREMAQRLREWEERHRSCESVLQLGEVVEDAENLLAAQNNEWSIRLS